VTDIRKLYETAITRAERDDSIPGVKEAREENSRVSTYLYGWQGKLRDVEKRRASKAKTELIEEANRHIEMARLALEASKAKLDALTDDVDRQRYLDLVRVHVDIIQSAFLTGGARYLHKVPGEDWGVVILEDPVFEYGDEHGPAFAVEFDGARISFGGDRDIRFTVELLSDERMEKQPKLREPKFGKSEVIVRRHGWKDEPPAVEVSLPSASFTSIERAKDAQRLTNAAVRLAVTVEEALLS
jgi:hypothetical protein